MSVSSCSDIIDTRLIRQSFSQFSEMYPLSMGSSLFSVTGMMLISPESRVK